VPCHEDTVAGTGEPDLPDQWLDNVKVFINASNIFVQIVLSAGTSNRF